MDFLPSFSEISASFYGPRHGHEAAETWTTSGALEASANCLQGRKSLMKIIIQRALVRPRNI